MVEGPQLPLPPRCPARHHDLSNATGRMFVRVIPWCHCIGPRLMRDAVQIAVDACSLLVCCPMALK